MALEMGAGAIRLRTPKYLKKSLKILITKPNYEAKDRH
jgi:hypothetical protein